MKKMAALLVALLPLVSSAGGPAEIGGYSKTHQVSLEDPTTEPDSIIKSYEKADAMPGIDAELAAVPFKQECRLLKGGFTCASGGKTPLAGATYRITHDESPRCGGQQADDRYTCVKGCTDRAPRYLTITPWEC